MSSAPPGGVLDLRVPGSRVVRTTMIGCARLTGAVVHVSSAPPEGVLDLRVPGSRFIRIYRSPVYHGVLDLRGSSLACRPHHPEAC